MRKFKGRKRERRKFPRKGAAPGEETRVRLPRDNEVLGHVEQLHGSRMMTVKCSDNLIRLCRVPGRMKKIWVRLNDYVLVQPWSVESHKKGDIVWRYREAELEQLRKRDMLEGL